jgi:hypothetical protein
MNVNMKRAKLVIVVIVLVQLAWFIYPRTGSLMGEAYRNQERIAAFKQNVEVPSPAAKAAVDQEMKLLAEHVRNHNLVMLACNLVIDGMLIFLCWSFSSGRKHHTTLNAIPKRC